jgi:hypothetical protein
MATSRWEGTCRWCRRFTAEAPQQRRDAANETSVAGVGPSEAGHGEPGLFGWASSGVKGLGPVERNGRAYGRQKHDVGEEMSLR